MVLGVFSMFWMGYRVQHSLLILLGILCYAACITNYISLEPTLIFCQGNQRRLHRGAHREVR